MYRKRNVEWLRHLDFILIDMLCMVAAMVAVVMLRKGGDSFQQVNLQVYGSIVILHFLLTLISHPYKNVVQRGYYKEFAAIFKHFTKVNVLLIVILYILHVPTQMPRLSVGLQWILAMLLANGIHAIHKATIRHRLANDENKRQMLLVTSRDHAVDTYRAITKKLYSSIRIAAIVLTDADASSADLGKGIDASLIASQPEFSGMTILHGMEDGYEYIRTHVVDEVFLDRYDSWNDWREMINNMLMTGLVVHVGLAGLDNDYPNSSMNHFGDRLAMTTTMNSAYSWQLAVKRLIDICGSLVGLVLLGLASIFVVPAIKIADPGPVIFAQTRMGTNGRPFKFYKFRSMYMDAEARKAELMDQNQMSGLMFKMENDPRIIGSDKGPGKGIGNFIRKTSLDELPQFWNVLKGDMSLVGTRPPTAGEYEQYEMRHKIRLSMKPGITGMWQVSGRSDITDFEEVVRLDTEYIENWNLGLDIKILFKTVMVVLHKDGSR